MGMFHVVVVDDRSDRIDTLYAVLYRAAAAGTLTLHVCVDGRSALRLARRCRADCWLVAAELPDMSGFDLLEMFRMLPADGERPSHAASTPAMVAQAPQGGIFMIADSYSMADEQRALAAGVAGYLVQPVGLDVVASMRLVAPRAEPPHAAGLKAV